MGETHLTSDNGGPINLADLPGALAAFTESVDRFYEETVRREWLWKVLAAINTVVMVAMIMAGGFMVNLMQDNRRILVLVEQSVGPAGLKRQEARTATIVDSVVERVADEIERRLATKPSP